MPFNEPSESLTFNRLSVLQILHRVLSVLARKKGSAQLPAIFRNYPAFARSLPQAAALQPGSRP